MLDTYHSAGSLIVSQARPLSSSWALSLPYWIVIAGEAAPGALWMQAAKAAGLTPVAGAPNMLALKTAPGQWTEAWQRILPALEESGQHESLRAAVIASETLPSRESIAFELSTLTDIQHVARNLWLLDDLARDHLVCFMQPVLDRRGKLAGHEALARIRTADGAIINGGDIMRASYALKVEYHVDRRLHKQAIETYASCDLSGYIFINFLTGFIHRPEVYLEGLSQAVEHHKITPHNVVLDIPLADYVRDMSKLRSIAHYCRARGFGIALDDVSGTRDLETLLHDVKPAFVKLDRHLGAGLLDSKRKSPVAEIVALSHATGALVLAEGVENQTLFDAYMERGVDMFQGYHCGAPEFISPAK